jgi:hypothetical protein
LTLFQRKTRTDRSIISTTCFKTTGSPPNFLKNQLELELEVPYEKEAELKVLNKILFKNKNWTTLVSSHILIS